MTTQQVIDALGVSRSTIMRLIAAGTLKPIEKPAVLKRPRRLEFRREDIEKLKMA